MNFRIIEAKVKQPVGARRNGLFAADQSFAEFILRVSQQDLFLKP